MGADRSIKNIFKQYEPSLYGKNMLIRGKGNNYNIFNLEYAKCYYFDLLYTLAISVPTWEGLPLEVDRDIMERILINNGSVVFYYDEILEKYLTLVLGEVSKYDTNGRPLEYAASTLYGNIVYKNLNPENSVIIWDRVTYVPTLANIEFYSGRLANLRLTIDQCVRNLKVPYVVSTTSNNKAAVEAIFTEVYEFMPAIIIDGLAEVENLKVNTLTDGIPYALQAAREEFTNTFNEALSSIGIANVSQETSKHEQMSEFEVEKTITGSKIQQESRLKPRQHGAELVNEVFGLDLKVQFNQIIGNLDGVNGDPWDEMNQAEQAENSAAENKEEGSGE